MPKKQTMEVRSTTYPPGRIVRGLGTVLEVEQATMRDKGKADILLRVRNPTGSIVHAVRVVNHADVSVQTKPRSPA